MITSLYLMLTDRCNSNCEYCYLSKQGIKSDPELHVKAASSFTEFINAHSDRITRRPQVRFVGGEPWVEAAHLKTITKSFLSKIPDGLVVVNSNGTLLREANLLDFKGDDRFVHVISLDGPKEVHDSRRKLRNGSGFERACEGISLLKRLGLPVIPNCVLDEQTLKTLPELVDFLREYLSLDQLSVSLRFDEANPMTLEGKYDTLKTAYELAEARSIRLGGHHRLHMGAKIPKLKCRAGTDTILINPDGTTNACQRFVGRKPDDPLWKEDFDWEEFESSQDCKGICGSDEDFSLGEMLNELYADCFPSYLRISDLDRQLFGVIR